MKGSGARGSLRGFVCISSTPGPGRARRNKNGTFSFRVGLTSASGCSTCPAGAWCTGGRLTKCTERTYNAHEGASYEGACLGCPTNAYSPKASTSASDCKCEAMFLDIQPGEGALPECVPCQTGMACDDIGITRHTLPLHPGYWRPSNTSLSVYRCPDAGENCGSLGECNVSSSGCRVVMDDDGARPCLPGLTGVFCRLCDGRNGSAAAPDDSSNHDGSATSTSRRYYRPANGATAASCEPCEDTVGMTVGVALGLPSLVLMGTYLVWTLFRCATPSLQAKIARLVKLARAFTVADKLKVRVHKNRPFPYPTFPHRAPTKVPASLAVTRCQQPLLAQLHAVLSAVIYCHLPTATACTAARCTICCYLLSSAATCCYLLHLLLSAALGVLARADRRRLLHDRKQAR